MFFRCVWMGILNSNLPIHIRLTTQGAILKWYDMMTWRPWMTPTCDELNSYVRSLRFRLIDFNLEWFFLVLLNLQIFKLSDIFPWTGFTVNNAHTNIWFTYTARYFIFKETNFYAPPRGVLFFGSVRLFVRPSVRPASV